MRSLVVLGLCWAALLGLLAAGGHQPSFTKLLPVAPERYYAVAAVYVLPLVVVLAHLFAWVARAAAAVQLQLSELTRTWARAVAGLFVVPDLLVYLVAGQGALGIVVRVTAPVTALAIVALTTRALRDAGASTGRAVGATLLALLVHAIPAGLLLR